VPAFGFQSINAAPDDEQFEAPASLGVQLLHGASAKAKLWLGQFSRFGRHLMLDLEPSVSEAVAKTRESRWSHWGALLVVLLLAAMAMRILQSGWPAPSGDSALFFPVASSLSDGKVDSFEPYTRLYFARGTGDWRYDLHGQLHAPLIALLALSGDYLDILGSAALWLLITMLVAAQASWVALAGLKLSATARAIGTVLGASAIGAIALGLNGRPEQLVPLAVMLLMWAEHLAPRSLHAYLRGISIGVLGALSPMSGLLGGAFIALKALHDETPLNWIKQVFVMGGVAAIAWWLIVIACSAHAPIAVFRNTLEQYASARFGGNMSRRVVAAAMSVDPTKPGLILVWMSWFALCAIGVYQRRQGVAHALLTAIFGLICAVLVYAFCFHRVQTYNLIGLAPIAFGAVLAHAARTDSQRTWLGWALALAVGIPSLGWVSITSQFFEYQTGGATLSEARSALRPRLDALKATEKLAISDARNPPLYLLEPRTQRMLTLADPTPEQRSVIEQAFSVQLVGFVVPGLDQYPPLGIPDWQPTLRFPDTAIAEPCIGYCFTLWEPPPKPVRYTPPPL
jgi:hypothetical protein